MYYVVRTSGSRVGYFGNCAKAIEFAAAEHRAGRNGVTVHSEDSEYNYSEFIAGFYNRF